MHSRGAALAAAVTVACVIAAGCHSGTTSAANGRAANAGATGGSQCTSAALSMSVDISQAGAAAGSAYYPVDFTNISATECAMTGYPGVSFVTVANDSGRQIGAAAQRDPQYDATEVRLAPHGHAHAWLQVGGAGNYPESSCHPVTAHGLRIYPPDQTQAGYVVRDFPACALASAGLLTILPLRPGTGAQGSTP